MSSLTFIRLILVQRGLANQENPSDQGHVSASFFFLCPYAVVPNFRRA